MNGQATATIQETAYVIKKKLNKRCAEWYPRSSGGNTGLTSGLTSRKCKRWEEPIKTSIEHGIKVNNNIYVLLNNPSQIRTGRYASNIHLAVHWYFNLEIKYKVIEVDNNLNWRAESTYSKPISLYINASNYIANSNSKQSTLTLNINSAKVNNYSLDMPMSINIRLSFDNINKLVN